MPEIRFEPTLFLFLGTSAGQVGARLRDLLREVYGDLPIHRFLWIDADTTVDPSVEGRFSPDERAELTGFNADDVLANLASYPSIKAWWPRASRLKPGFIQHGAGQIRLAGRLAFFRMYNDRTRGPSLIDKLTGATQALAQIENREATERMSTGRWRFRVEDGSVRVYVVFSTCGGTGSSMAFDVAYLCRHLLRGQNPKLIGVAILPRVIDMALKAKSQSQKDKIRANTYAWFKESNYLLENPSWRVQYPEGAEVNVQAPPFALHFVVDLINQGNMGLNSAQDVYKMAALAIFLDSGSSAAGAIRGFGANVDVLLDDFQERRRAYSSFAAGSLVYPVGRILGYCGASFGREIIARGLLAEPQQKAPEEATSALLGKLELRDDRLLATLLAGRQVPNLNAPAIRKAQAVEQIRSLLNAQDTQDSIVRQAQIEEIGTRAAALLRQAQESLDAQVAAIALTRGLPFAVRSLDLLLAEPREHPVPDSTLSLLGLRARLDEQGTSEADLRDAEARYRRAKEGLRALEGGWWQSTRKKLRPKAWKQDVARLRDDCLQWMATANQRALQLAAQREAANLYDQLAESARRLRDTLAMVRHVVDRALDDLSRTAQQHLAPPAADVSTFELALEAVDSAYVEEYFRRRAPALDAVAAHQAFARTVEAPSMAAMAAWHEEELARRVRAHAETYFAPELERTSLLQALADHYGTEALAAVEAKLDYLVRYCQPFWQYNASRGLLVQDGISIIGVEDENSDLIPPKYRQHLQYELKSTGFRHRIDLVNVYHGLPAFLLHGMADWKSLYDAKRKGLDPLHILEEASLAEEVIPEGWAEARGTFAAAVAFGYIVQLGPWYYFDPRKEHTKGIHPGRENRLGQGRVKAEDAFVQRDELVRMAEDLIERDIVAMGNDAAIRLLAQRITELSGALAAMGIDNELRRQYQKEIQALEARQRQLATPGGPDLSVPAR